MQRTCIFGRIITYEHEESEAFGHCACGIEQRNYFPFYDYEYALDVALQKKILPATKDLYEGLKESYEWYKKNKEQVKKKNFIEYIDQTLA